MFKLLFKKYLIKSIHKDIYIIYVIRSLFHYFNDVQDSLMEKHQIEKRHLHK